MEQTIHQNTVRYGALESNQALKDLPECYDLGVFRVFIEYIKKRKKFTAIIYS